MKIHFTTYGCSNNFSESEIMAGLLKQKGHKISTLEEADYIILNLCTVKGDKQAYKHVKTHFKTNKKLIVGGCIRKDLIGKIKQDFPNTIFINTYNIQNIVQVIENEQDSLGYEDFIKVNLPKVRTNPIISIVAISTGCLSHCTYCSVKQIKGKLISYPEEKILYDIKQSINEGCKEIWLTSQDNGCFGFDRSINLAKLLKKIINIEGDFKVRIGMASPQHIMKFTEELIEVLKHPKLFRFIHLPVQSGSNKVLKDMNREHTIDEYKHLIKTLKTAIPDLTITTDIIVGFPTEDEQAFQDTLNLIKETKPEAVNISRYSARPNTLAFKLKQHHGRVLKQRSRILTELCNKIYLENNKFWQDWEGEIIIDEKSSKNWIGRNYAYKQIILNGNYKLGQKVKIKVKGIDKYHLTAL